MSGGIQAGRLGIDIVAEVARLEADMSKIRRIVKDASGDIAKNARAANDNLANMSAGMARTAPSAKQAAFGMRNLGFQVQDLGVQFTQAAASGDPLKGVLMALVMQGPQIKDAFNQTGKSLLQLVGGFVTAHPLLLALTVAIGLAYGAFKLFQSQVDKSGELDRYSKSLGLTKEEMAKLKDVGVTAGDMFKGLWRTLDQGFGAGKIFATIKQWAVDAFKTALDWANNFAAGAYAAFVGSGKAVIAMGTAAKQALAGDFSGALETVKSIPKGYTDAFGQAKKTMSSFYADWKRNSIDAAKDRLKAEAATIIDKRKDKKDTKGETRARETQATEALITGLYKLADAYAVSEAAGLKAEITAKATADGIKKQADVAAYVAQQIRLMVAERTRDAAKDAAGMEAQTAARAKLNDQVAAGVITSEQAAVQLQNEAQLRPFLTALALAEGDAKTKLAEVIERLRKAMKDANDEATRTQSLQIAEQKAKSTAMIEKEIELTKRLGDRRVAALKGLHGRALREELAAINVEQEKAAILMRAQAEAAELIKKGMPEAAEAVRKEAEAAIRLVEAKATVDKAEEAAQRDRERAKKVAYEIADIIGGGVGQSIKDLADALEKAFPDFMQQIGEQLKGLEGLGDLFKQMSAGAKVGSATAGIMKGLGIKTSSTGAQIGGAIGQFAGPLGAIGGSIVGGLIGGMFKKVKKASATVEIIGGEAMQTSLSGNSAKLKKVAGAMADGLIGGLSQIADQLGGVLGGAVKISIGQRDKTFRVDTAGLGRTKGMPKFDTEEEAIQYAIQQAILQGAITGLRTGAETLIKAEGDLNEQLQKALSFEGVFKELEQRANPAKASIDAITKEFDKLIDIFEEANASADDYAKLQELMAKRQREVIEQAFEPIRAMLDDLKGKAEEAGDAVRNAYEAVLDRESQAVAAYEDALAEARRAGEQRWLDAVTTGYNEEIDRLKAGIDAIGNSVSTLRDEAEALAKVAEQLSDFSANIFGAGSGQSNVRFSADAARAAAQAGDIDALNALKTAAIANAKDSVSMRQNLAILKVEADRAAASFGGRADAKDAQAAAAQAQVDALEQQISLVEDQIEIAKAQLDKTSEVADSTKSLSELFADMQSAREAADLARAQWDKLDELHETDLSFAEAVAGYEKAKADRDDLIREITAAGFADLITVQQQTGAQMVAALADVAAVASLASANAAAAIATAQKAQEDAAKAANDNAGWQSWMGQIPFFAAGGEHGGGLRVVGENGPELEATGPSRIWNTDQLASALVGGSNAEEFGDAVAERLVPYLYEIAKSTGKSTSILKKFDGDGMPAERDVA